ncbi:MAG: hypothetical protein Q4F33_01980 [Mycoplasmatota bacterium]|nr:hypothetical protein [Mycoplasmatota bacterium]
MTNQEATKDLFEYNNEFLCNNENYGYIYYCIQWKYGKLLLEIKEAALKYIIEKWTTQVGVLKKR